MEIEVGSNGFEADGAGRRWARHIGRSDSPGDRFGAGRLRQRTRHAAADKSSRSCAERTPEEVAARDLAGLDQVEDGVVAAVVGDAVAGIQLAVGMEFAAHLASWNIKLGGIRIHRIRRFSRSKMKFFLPCHDRFMSDAPAMRTGFRSGLFSITNIRYARNRIEFICLSSMQHCGIPRIWNQAGDAGFRCAVRPCPERHPG
jgi:hypothetical protein